MDELRARPEAERGPAVLRVVAPLRRLRGRAVDDGLAERLEDGREGSGQRHGRRLVRRPNLERAEARMRTDVPPEARVAVSEPEALKALHERFPLRVRGERRRRGSARQL